MESVARRTPFASRYAAWSVLFAMLLAVPAAAAQDEKEQHPWNLKHVGDWDQPINDALGKGFFFNLGPTGLRAMITTDQPRYFKIMFVFKDSPAAGKIKPGDVVVGVNGKMLTAPYPFKKRGGGDYPGPLRQIAELIEDSQGERGELELIVWPKGAKADQKKVTVKIPAVGRFSPTYPDDCPRSEKLRRRLCDFLVEEHERQGRSFGRGPHTRVHCLLALMAAGDPRYMPLLKEEMARLEGARFNPEGEGLAVWGWGYTGIALGEWYLLTRDPKVVPTLRRLSDAWEVGQDWRTGASSHNPFPAIQLRIANGGGAGYGPIAMTGSLMMLAMSLMKEGGLHYPEESYERMHQAYLCTADSRANIGYAYRRWDHAEIMLKDASSSPCKSPKGVGYLCPTGMEDIGAYTILNDRTCGCRPGDTSWVAAEAATNRVYMQKGARRLVVRNMPTPEPTGPIQTSEQGAGGSFGNAGLGALSHTIGNRENASWKFFADHLATGAARSHATIFDGHASFFVHVLWGSMGAARASDAEYRTYMDNIKWWFILAEPHDGKGFVILPGRDRAQTDPFYGRRTLAAGTAALILNGRNGRLRITGANASGGPVATASSSRRRGSTRRGGLGLGLRKSSKPREKTASVDGSKKQGAESPSGTGEEKPAVAPSLWVGLRVRLEGSLLVIHDVLPQSPAARSGITAGIPIFSVEGKLVTDVGAIRGLVAKVADRKRLKMTLLKNGQPHDLVVPLERIPKKATLPEDGF